MFRYLLRYKREGKTTAKKEKQSFWRFEKRYPFRHVERALPTSFFLSETFLLLLFLPSSSFLAFSPKLFFRLQPRPFLLEMKLRNLSHLKEEIVRN